MAQNVLKEVFATDVFSDAVMQERLPKKVYASFMEIVENGGELDITIANVIAHAMKEWAVEHGATHYSHWFQPMTGITAEKHDSFLNASSTSEAILEFSGKELIKGEPDASSFPSGGLRATFEARGYTAWDITSPAFLREDAAGVTLCIPTAFCSYTGEALDKKTPLLRSMEAINKQATHTVHLFGYTDVKKVECSVGPEQEYFLIDREKYLKRDDLIFSGRTLFGAMPPKGQELDDHYFGTIRERIASYMKELNIELWKLGILAKTQHNEAAPAQHEMAPIYSTANIATDHNQLTMETMKRVARRHGLECLLHEKPFEGVNGSGKHDNWSLVTDTGVNLLDPGKEPHNNLMFLYMLSAVIKAVKDYAPLLRLSASNVGNDHRLGANEAPPAIISVFLGEQLEDIVDQIIENGEATSSIRGEKMNTGVTTLPNFRKDATDRNRTSPFAFTGNKFEFRMVASSMSVSGANTVLNSIVADTLENMNKNIEGLEGEEFISAVKKTIQTTLKDNKNIIFNGNGYSDEWVEEAIKRELPNVKTMVDATKYYTDPTVIAMFERQNVYTEIELKSREEINYETYSKMLHIEALTMIEMASKLYIPAIIRYCTSLAKSINEIKATGIPAATTVQNDLLIKASSLLADAQNALSQLIEKTGKAEHQNEGEESAVYYRDVIREAMTALRTPIDALEMIVDKSFWPVPTYGDILFEI
ncbi:MAG: glutamine synthetase type III [Lachnospiraceae bacterium]|nr:glutamine synthetase type III [Lachnospiraceae bacterium]